MDTRTNEGCRRRRGSRRQARLAAALACASALVTGCDSEAVARPFDDSPLRDSSTPVAPEVDARASLELARSLRANGDVTSARLVLDGLRASGADSAVLWESGLELGILDLQDGRIDVAAASLGALLPCSADESPNQARMRLGAALRLGGALERDGALERAAALYHVAVDGPSTASLEDVLWLRVSALARALRNDEEAATALDTALSVAQTPAARARVHEAIGDLRLAQDRHAEALGAFELALGSAIEGGARPARLAELASKQIRPALAVGKPEQVTEVRRRIVTDWPQTRPAWHAAVALGPEVVPWPDRVRMALDQGRYAELVPVATQILRNHPSAEQRVEAHYLIALAGLRTGRKKALSRLEDFARAHETSPWGAEALWEAIGVHLLAGRVRAATVLARELLAHHPRSPRAPGAAFWLAAFTTSASDRATYLQIASTGDLDDPLTLRALDRLRGAAEAQPRDSEPALDRLTFERWLAEHGRSIPEMQTLRTRALADVRLERAIDLGGALLEDLAEEELYDLFAAYENEPLVVEAVGRELQNRGLYALSVTTGHLLLDTLRPLGAKSALSAPRAAQTLAYPLAYWPVVEREANVYNVDPLLLLALVKHESWFRPEATSSVNARGLTQFMEPTATEIAATLGYADWSWSQMTRPDLSIEFAAYYVSRLSQTFDDRMTVLAAYNAGPGRVQRWLDEFSGLTPDAFVERLPYLETRKYVRAIGRTHALYRSIYGIDPDRRGRPIEDAASASDGPATPSPRRGVVDPSAPEGRSGPLSPGGA